MSGELWKARPEDDASVAEAGDTTPSSEVVPPSQKDPAEPQQATINRYSSRRGALDNEFLRVRLRDAKSYTRIAGYFRSSILEIAGEELSHVDEIRVVCNSEVDFSDVKIAQRARDEMLKERWNRDSGPAEALIHRDRYQRLHELLTSGRLQVRVVPRSAMFLHGKAGVIESRNGDKTSFVGSANETRSGFGHNYEIVWEDSSADAVSWVEEEFAALWEIGVDLPNVVVAEIGRLARRVEVEAAELAPAELPGAVFVESPMYNAGQVLQPWQQSFVSTFLTHRDTYGKARLLLADEVGLGKTLSLGASAVISSVLGDGPTLILCPATLTRQWQAELLDRLGAPSAVWSSTRKCWIDPHGHHIPTRGPEDVVRCPYQIAIVSTGLITNNGREAEALRSRSYGMVILDEAHKARSARGLGQAEQPNNLLRFMFDISTRTQHVLLGTATPIQTTPGDLWDLMNVLNVQSPFVLGTLGSQWTSGWESAHSMVVGHSRPATARELWEWIRNPLPPATEDHHGGLYAQIRQLEGVSPTAIVLDRALHDLDELVCSDLEDAAVHPEPLLRASNPMLRHTVLRRRDELERRGLLERIDVSLHPVSGYTYPGVLFTGRSLATHPFFQSAYEAAEQYCASIRKRDKNAGFMKTLMLQRLCSSVAAGMATAQKLLNHEPPLDDAHDTVEDAVDLQEQDLTAHEQDLLRQVIGDLSRLGPADPKLRAVLHFLQPVTQGGAGWLDMGCIVFSQYYDTAHWIARELSVAFPNEPVGLYTSTARSGLWKGGQFTTANRNDLKRAVQDRELCLMVATDAACEGLNLQMLGTLINVDLPWNPSRVEQRLGRIKRFGQLRPVVDVLNLSYAGTQDEQIHNVLAERFKDIFETFGGLTEALDADWIDDVEELRKRVDTYISERQDHQKNPFDVRYMTDENLSVQEGWEKCERVLSRPDIDDRLRRPW